MAGPKRSITLKKLLQKIDEDKSYFDRLYETLSYYAYVSQGKSSDIRINYGKKNFIVGGSHFSEGAAKLLRKTRAELRKLNFAIDSFFENVSD